MGRGTLVDGSGVTSEVNYVRNSPAHGQVLEFVTADEERSTMQTLPGRSMPITNARPLTTDLDREGFVLVRHASSISDFGRIEEDPDVDQRYVAEMTGLLAQVTGADKVYLLGAGKKRYGESATQELSPLLQRQAGALSARGQHRRIIGRTDRADRAFRRRHRPCRVLKARDVQRVASGLTPAAGHSAGGLRRAHGPGAGRGDHPGGVPGTPR